MKLPFPSRVTALSPMPPRPLQYVEEATETYYAVRRSANLAYWDTAHMTLYDLYDVVSSNAAHRSLL